MPILDLYRGLNKIATPDEILEINQLSERYGLILDTIGALEILKTRNQALRDYGRIELSNEPIKNMIKTFCSSPYIHKHNYVEVLSELIDIFYCFKNETRDLISDQELLSLMKEYYDTSCSGSLDLLRNREMMILVGDIGRRSWEDNREEESSNGPQI
ncbi:MAG: hypothetical protein GX119_00420 [Syntrophomonadaceae bacterium]|nr:hypothetical protein [Syntrophomonadaceae bacterium]